MKAINSGNRYNELVQPKQIDENDMYFIRNMRAACDIEDDYIDVREAEFVE